MPTYQLLARSASAVSASMTLERALPVALTLPPTPIRPSRSQALARHRGGRTVLARNRHGSGPLAGVEPVGPAFGFCHRKHRLPAAVSDRRSALDLLEACAPPACQWTCTK